MRIRMWSIAILAFILASPDSVKAGPISKLLKAGLLRRYNKMERPLEGGKPVTVTLSVMPQGLQSIEEGTLEALVKMNALISLSWKDGRLGWVDSRFGAESFPFPADDIWKPDIRLLNGLDPNPDMDKSIHPVLHHDGSVTYVYPQVMMAHCHNARTHRANWECPFTFGSWTYDVTSLDLRVNDGDVDLSLFDSATWLITNASAQRDVIDYSGQSYSEITYRVQILRR